MGRRAGMSLVSLSLYILIIIVMSLFIVAKPNPERIEDDGLRDFAITLDTSLSQWYAFHSGSYPETLTTMIDAKVLPEHAPVHKFTYTTNGEKTKYHMIVILNNSTWTTPGSNL